ncbi:DUF6520 family protein [Flagellimonas oceanensis]|uniref:DUF6520 family protein n=1 Tax=Flagellimonas oceanensis TaxID=2499163 RepID=UPI003BAB0479
MKSSFFKIVLPAFAILLAAGLAFATEDRNIPQTGYYDHPILGVQEIETDCLDSGSDQCMVNDQYPVFKNQGLSIPLYERPE